MSIKARHTYKHAIRHLSVNNNVLFHPAEGSESEISSKSFDSLDPEVIVLRVRPDGQLVDSNVIFDEVGCKPKKIDEVVPREDFDLIAQNIRQTVEVRSVSSVKLSEHSSLPDGSKRAAHFVPVAEDEVLVIISRCLPEKDQMKKLDANLKAMIHMLEFLPGKTIVADANHRLLNITRQEKKGWSNHEECNQIGAYIGCAHYHEGSGDCGKFPVCNKCDLQAAIQKVVSDNQEIFKQPICLPLKINNQLQFKDFSLTVSQAEINGGKYFVVYLEDADDQKVRLKQLQDSNELLRNVLDSLPFSVYWKNLNSTFLGGNIRFAEENKVKHQDQIFGQRYEQLYNFELAREHQKQDEIALKIEKPLWNCQGNSAGQQSKRNNFKSILKDASGKRIGLVGVSLDLAQNNWFQIHGSDCKTDLNEALSEIEDYGVFDWFLKIDMLKGNNAFLKMAGMQNYSVFLDDLLANVENDQERESISNIKKQIEEKGDYHFLVTLKYLHPVINATTWLELSGKKIYKDLYGKVIKVTCLLKDVTEEKQKELDRQNEQAFISAFLDSTKDAIWSVDRDFKITSFNQSFKANYLMAFGIELEIGSCCLDALENTMKSKWTKRYNKALSGSSFKVVDHVEYEGLPQIAETVLSPIRIDGQIVGLSCFSRDISKREV